MLDDGQIVWLGGEVPDTPGYDLCGIFVGSEGTMGIVTKVAVRLMQTRESVRTLLAIFDQMEVATRTVVDITAAGIIPAALEMMDRTTIEAVETGSPVGFPRDAEAVLLVEVEGLLEQTERSMNLARTVCERNGAREVRVAKDDTERQLLWKGRKGAFGAMGALAPNYYVQDGVVPRSKLPEMMKRVAEISKQYNLRIANVFHAGDGNLHPNILFDMRTPGELDRVIEAGAATLRACIELGGSITGEHGIGLEKKAYIGLLFNEADLEAMSRVRRAFDPDGRFNPAKLFPNTRQLWGDAPATSEYSGGVVDLKRDGFGFQSSESGFRNSRRSQTPRPVNREMKGTPWITLEHKQDRRRSSQKSQR